MEILVLTSKERVQKFTDWDKVSKDTKIDWADYMWEDEKILETGRNAQAILVDAIGKVSGKLMERMPNLRLIQSEGVGYDGIDIRTADKLGIYVCNNKGANANAVAEQTIMLMLAVLKKLVLGDKMTRAGKQIEAKSSWIVEGIPELGGKTVGIIGLGDIGLRTAVLCNAFGCRVIYNKRNRLTIEEEKKYGVEYNTEDEILKNSDIVSLHMPLNESTRGYINLDKLRKMKKTAIIINTARGEIIKNEDLIYALDNGIIAGAGLDTVAPEPVLKDNPLLNINEAVASKITFSPHIGGVTTDTFIRIYKNIWENINIIRKDGVPKNIVNTVK